MGNNGEAVRMEISVHERKIERLVQWMAGAELEEGELSYYIVVTCVLKRCKENREGSGSRNGAKGRGVEGDRRLFEGDRRLFNIGWSLALQ